ncbi:unnamed protein product [Ectocarpus sp. CCAP 1310/34]|nr:unnamed protein product [Ectocarpus sp. CCAP 1310/34]
MKDAKCRTCVVACALLLAGARAFVVNPTLLSSRAPGGGSAAAVGTSGRTGSLSMAAPLEGAHGMRSRFLPVDQMDDEVFAPRIVQVAGVLPEITVADIMAVGFTPAPEMGMWQYDFSDPEGPQLGTVAVPGGEQVFKMKEPVAIVCPNDDLNIQMPNDEKAEMLLVIDRANREFEFGKFFLWDTPSDGLVVRYFEGEPTPGFACVGRVGIVLAPFLPSMAKKSSGFEEEDY